MSWCNMLCSALLIKSMTHPGLKMTAHRKKDYTVKYTELGGRINVTMQLKWNCFEIACRLMKYIGDRMTMSSHCHCLIIVIVLNLFKIILFVYRISNVTPLNTLFVTF